MDNGENIVRAARGWLGTRFHHQGRLRKTASHRGGVDCLGLLTGIAAELDLRARDGTPLAALDRTDYGHYPDCDAMRAALDKALLPIVPGVRLPGDVLLLEVDLAPRHLAIVAGEAMIHAYAPARAVVEHALDDWWVSRITACYRVT